MKQIDPNHHFGQISNNYNLDVTFEYGFFKKTIVKVASIYMRSKTKKFLDFEYTTKSILPPQANKNKKYLLYLHIPFCKTLCPYCSFHKFKFEEEKAREYFNTLRKEMDIVKALGYDFVSLYIGGGTTTILPEELVKTIDYAKELFSIKDISCEGDPLIDDKLVALLSKKVDRLSIGVQTTNDEMLKKIKRYKKFGSSKIQLENISKAIGKFPIVNIDLIFNLPSQTEQMLENDLDTILKLTPEQISVYPLMYSPSVKKRIEKNLGKLHNDSEVKFYNIILQTLQKKYNQISSWTFSKKDINTFDEYVVEYKEYIGLGSGSFSFIEDTLYINTFSLEKYKKYVEQGNLSLERFKKYNKNDILKYQLMLDLFSNNIDIKKYKKNKVLFWLLKYLGIVKKDYIQTTPFGKYLLLVLMKEFYIGMDYVRETSRLRLKK
jgi:coproporphyrinogen III oxidase-like Fe-S oxidoreductase